MQKGQPLQAAPQTVEKPQGGSEGRSPPSNNPNPATCAVDSEALRSKVSSQGSPPAPQAQVNPVSAEKIAAGELFRRPEGQPLQAAPGRKLVQMPLPSPEAVIWMETE